MPAMTKEERNKRKQDLRWQKNHASYKARLASLIELWIRAKRDKMTCDEINDYRREWIWGDNTANLPNWIIERLAGADELCFDRTYREDLVFCYPHPETGVITPASVICDAGLAGELARKGLDKQGRHYWKNDDPQSFTHPF